MANYRGRRGGAKGRVKNRRSNLSKPVEAEPSQEETAPGPVAKVINLFRSAKRPQ